MYPRKGPSASLTTLVKLGTVKLVTKKLEHTVKPWVTVPMDAEGSVRTEGVKSFPETHPNIQTMHMPHQLCLLTCPRSSPKPPSWASPLSTSSWTVVASSLSPTSALYPPQSVLHTAAKGRLRDKWHHPAVLWVSSSAPRAVAIRSTFLTMPCPSISLPTTCFLWTHWSSAVSSDSPGSGLPQDLGACCSLCKECSSPSSNMAEAPPYLTVCISPLYTFCSSSHALQFNRHLSTFTDMQTDLCRSDMTKVIQMVIGTAQERWHPNCPQSPSSQPLDDSSWSHLASMPKFWPCSSLCWMGTAGMLLSQQQHWHTSPVCHVCFPFWTWVTRLMSQSPMYLHNPGHCMEQQGWKMRFSWLLPIKPARTQWTPLYTEN